MLLSTSQTRCWKSVPEDRSSGGNSVMGRPERASWSAVAVWRFQRWICRGIGWGWGMGVWLWLLGKFRLWRPFLEYCATNSPSGVWIGSSQDSSSGLVLTSILCAKIGLFVRRANSDCSRPAVQRARPGAQRCLHGVTEITRAHRRMARCCARGRTHCEIQWRPDACVRKKKELSTLDCCGMV